MNEWQVALCCMGIVIGAVLFCSVIKLIYLKIKKDEADKSKLEYPLTALSFGLAFMSIALFLKYYMCYNLADIFKYATLYAGTVNTIYLLIFQLIRKGFSGLWQSIIKIYTKLKTSKNPVAELPNIVEEVINSDEQNNSDIGKELVNKIFEEKK